MRLSAFIRRVKRLKEKALFVLILLSTALYVIMELFHSLKELDKESLPNFKILFNSNNNVVLDTVSKQESSYCKHGRSLKHIQKNISSHFPLIEPYIEPEIPCEDRELYLPVVVNSAAVGDRHRLLRATIRQTWGNSSENSGDKKWRLFFSLGLCNDEKQNELNIQEALENNDVIIGKFTDTYGNIVYKTFMGISWVYSRFSCQYFMKTDDDVYVRIPEVIHWLVKSGSPSPFYGGFIAVGYHVYRDPASIYYISKERFNESDWPPFALGAFGVFSAQSLPWYLNYTQYRWPFKTDDTYMAVAARDFGIRAVHIQGFRISALNNYCDLLNITAIGYSFDPPVLLKYHDFYRKSARVQTLKACNINS